MTDRLTLRVGIDGPTGGIQVSLSQLDEHGAGHGYRLAGPKFTGSGEVLVSRDLDEADAAEIRRYLDYYGHIAGELADAEDEDYDGYDPDDDWYDDDDYREPDPEDAEIARSYEEHYEHCETVHGGGECDCRPSLLQRHAWRVQAAARRLPGIWYRARYATRQPWTLRLPGAEITVRLRPRNCGACSGRGWFYSKTGIDPHPMPPGYDGVSLCGCGTAIGKLAESRRAVRQMRREGPPF